MIIRKEEKRCITFGEDLPDVQRWITDAQPTWSIRSSLSATSRDSWDLGIGFEGAMRLARVGWSEGAKDLSNRLSAHMPARDHVDSWRYDVAGELPDIGRFLAGDPAHMRRHGHPKGRRPIIGLAINIAVSGGIQAKQLANYGAALVAAIDQIENAGRRVDLVVAMMAQQGALRNVVGWQVKQADDAVDLAAIAFSIAHPASLRRLGFAMYERSDSCTWPSYGQPGKLVPEDLPDPLPNVLCLSGLTNNFGACQTLGSAITFVRDEINAAAGEELVTVEA